MSSSAYPLAISSWGEEEVVSACEVLQAGHTTMGRRVREFEEQFSNYLGVKHTYMVNSGSSANLLMAMALKIYLEFYKDSRKTLIIPAVGWSTSYAPFIQLGFNVKIVDVSSATFNINVEELEAIISDDVVAILAINILGNPSDLFELSSFCDFHNIFLLEDNCESLGAELVHSLESPKKAGSFGAMSTHSFFFSHHISTMEGGSVSSSSPEFSLLLKILRNHGWIRDLDDDDFKLLSGESPIFKFIKDSLSSLQSQAEFEFMKSFYFLLPGFNLRPTEIQGAVGLIQLSKFNSFLETRRSNARVLTNALVDFTHLHLQRENGRSSFFGFGFLTPSTESRNQVVAFLRENNVQVRPIVSGNIANHPLASYMDLQCPLPNSQLIHSNGFFVGNHHLDYSSQLVDLVQSLKQVIS